MNRTLLLSMAALWASGCVHVNSLSLTQVPLERDQRVEAHADSGLVFFHLNLEDDFAEGLVDDLVAQCPSGRVEGLLTKDEQVRYFAGVTRRRVMARGFCVP